MIWDYTWHLLLLLVAAFLFLAAVNWSVERPTYKRLSTTRYVLFCDSLAVFFGALGIWLTHVGLS